MNPNGDYTVHFADPDIYFQWNDILQVIIPRTSALASASANEDHEGHTSCPICMSPPTAPRMTKCGHIYCFPCILRYLSSSENKWAKCPLCSDSVTSSQLKSVKCFDGPLSTEHHDVPSSSSSSASATTFEDSPRVGGTLTMRLIQRPQITTLALPRSHTWPSDLLPPHQAPFHFLPDVYNYAKFMLATPEMLVSDLTKDLDDLIMDRRLLAGMNDELAVAFVDVAEAKVRNQIAKASALDTPVLQKKIEKSQRDLREIEGRVAYREQRRIEEEARIQSKADTPYEGDIPQELLSLKFGTITPTPPTPQALPPSAKPTSTPNRSTPKQRRNVNPPPPTTSTYYYYQAASGLPLYLHPLDIRILLAHFTSYASFPDNITIRIGALSEGTVNDDLRKRCKYLAHTPEGADVVFIEADLEEVVGKETLKNFEGALKMRKAKRRDKGKKDDRARARAQEREKEKHDYEAAVEWRFTPSAMSTEFVDVADESVLFRDEASFPGFEDVPSAATHSPPQTQTQQRAASGAWGSKSFASALHSVNTPQPRNSPSASRGRQQTEEDEWEMDIAWHELEQRGSGGGGNGGKKKKGNKLVLLGGGGGRRR